jgi:hypothetical protein
MTKKKWRKPEIKRIEAGSAEGPTPPGRKDGPGSTRS